MNGDKFKETLGTFTRIAIPHFGNLFYLHLEAGANKRRAPRISAAAARSPGPPACQCQ